MALRRNRRISAPALGPEKNICYVLYCASCKEKILGECSCPAEVKPVVYRGTCKPCEKKSKAL